MLRSLAPHRSAVLTMLGLACVVIAAFLVFVALGWLATGAALFVLDWALGPDRSRP